MVKMASAGTNSWVTAANTTVELNVLGGELVFCGVKRPDLIPSKV